MARKFQKRVTRRFGGKTFRGWTREPNKNAALAEKKTLKNQNKRNEVRIVKAPGPAGKAGFYDVYLRKHGKQRRRF